MVKLIRVDHIPAPELLVKNVTLDKGKMRIEVSPDYSKKSGTIYTYNMYQADSSKEAKAFLASITVLTKFVYYIVETREGTFGKDISGSYEEGVNDNVCNLTLNDIHF